MSLVRGEALRRKVERGEPLGEEELACVAAEARATPGPEWKLVLAHALSNSGADAEALPLVAALARDYPRDHRVRLLRARVLAGLSRFDEAEAVLREVAGQRAKDPEVEKALALLALRRGELSGAGQRIDEVLRLDPIDDEARLVRAELTAAEGPGPSLALSALGAELEAALSAEGLSFVRRGDELVVRLSGGGSTRLELTAVRAGLQAEAGPAGAALRAIAAQLARPSLATPSERGALLSSVLPVLRDEKFRAPAAGAVFREGPAGLLVYHVIADPELVRHVPEEALRTAGVSLEELDEAAFRNLELLPAPVAAVVLDGGGVALAGTATGLAAVCAGDGHDAARLLTPAQRAGIEAALGAGPLLVSLGRRELALLCREDDDAAAAALRVSPVAANGIEGVFRLEAGLLRR